MILHAHESERRGLELRYLSRETSGEDFQRIRYWNRLVALSSLCLPFRFCPLGLIPSNVNRFFHLLVFPVFFHSNLQLNLSIDGSAHDQGQNQFKANFGLRRCITNFAYRSARDRIQSEKSRRGHKPNAQESAGPLFVEREAFCCCWPESASRCFGSGGLQITPGSRGRARIVPRRHAAEC